MHPHLLIMAVSDAGGYFRITNGYDGSEKSTVTNTITLFVSSKTVVLLSRLSAKNTDLSMLYPLSMAVDRVTGDARTVVD